MLNCILTLFASDTDTCGPISVLASPLELDETPKFISELYIFVMVGSLKRSQSAIQLGDTQRRPFVPEFTRSFRNARYHRIDRHTPIDNPWVRVFFFTTVLLTSPFPFSSRNTLARCVFVCGAAQFSPQRL